MRPLSDEVARAISRHAEAAYPNECVGLLVGTRERIVEAVPVQNLATVPSHRCEVAAAELLRAHRAADARGLEVIGAYHSHPDGPPAPSEFDRGLAIGRLVIVAVQRGRAVALYDSGLGDVGAEPS